MVVYLTKNGMPGDYWKSTTFSLQVSWHIRACSRQLNGPEQCYNSQELDRKAFSCGKNRVCARRATEGHHHSECQAGPHSKMSPRHFYSLSQFLREAPSPPRQMARWGMKYFYYDVGACLRTVAKNNLGEYILRSAWKVLLLRTLSGLTPWYGLQNCLYTMSASDL
jgi:hypothetical protein